MLRLLSSRKAEISNLTPVSNANRLEAGRDLELLDDNMPENIMDFLFDPFVGRLIAVVIGFIVIGLLAHCAAALAHPLHTE